MKKSPLALNVNITASRVGAYYDHSCPRFTAYNIIADPALVGWSERDNRSTAIREAGKVWEKEALCILEETGMPCYAEDADGRVVEDFRSMMGKEKKFRDLSEDVTIDIFRSPKEFIKHLESQRTGYIYQTTISATDSFKSELLYGNGESSRILRDMFEDRDECIHANWSICKPDLIRVDLEEDGTPVFSVIDMKHAKRAHLSHKVQVAIYVRLLEALFRDKGIKGRINSREGYLWNFKKAEPRAFDLSTVMPYMEKFFRSTLPETLYDLKKTLPDTFTELKSSDKSEVGDLLNRKFCAIPTQMCEWCDNYQVCIEWQKENEPVTLLPYLSSYAQEYLRRRNIPLKADEFRIYISNEDNRKRMSEDCYSLKKVLRDGIEDVDTLITMLEDKDTDKKAQSRGVSSLSMPSWQDVSIVLTAQRDEAMDRMYALGIRAQIHSPGIDPLGTGFRESDKKEKYANAYEKIILAKNRDDIDRCIREFMDALYEVLKKCSDHNTATDNEPKITVQGYVMDNYERINIEEALMDELLNGDGAEDIEYRGRLLSLLYWMQGESMITDVDEQSSQLGVDFPLIVLTGVTRRLFSIPAFISYNLETTSSAILERKAYKRIEKYAHLLSNTMKSDPVNKLWDRREFDEEEYDKIKNHISTRLGIEIQIAREIQKKMKGILRRRPEPFRLDPIRSDMDVRAAKLWTEYQYEELINYHDMRSVRMGDLAQLADDGIIMRLVRGSEEPVIRPTYIRGADPQNKNKDGYKCRYLLDNPDSYYNGEMFMGLLIRADDDVAADELVRLTKKVEAGILPNSIIGYDHPVSRVYGADNISMEVDENGVTYVSFERFAGTDEDERFFVNGSAYYMLERYKDFQSEKENRALTRDSGCVNTDRRSYLYPEKWYGMSSDADGLEKCLKYKPHDNGHDFTDSQSSAFEQLFKNNITLLLGPPGTGKTDFIARAVITICKYYAAEKGSNLSVLVSANSHSAINNILAKTAEKLEGEAGEPVLFKLDKWGDSDKDEGIEGVDIVKDFVRFDDNETVKSLKAYNFEDDKPFVMGATCWKSYESVSKYNRANGDEEFSGFDIVVIDEASQMLMSGALLSMQASLNNPNTRFLIVGDEDQLPPILKGKYDPTDQPVDFYGSVFRSYLETAYHFGLDYTVQLEEQFRMNEILSRYPAEYIYGVDMDVNSGRRGYHAFDFGTEDPKIASQIVTLRHESNDEIIRAITDPEYPIVVCRIHDGGAMAKRDAEIALVSRIIGFLRENMIDPDNGQVYPEGADGDHAFWGSSSGEGGVGIISPHHEQINRLKEKITSDTGMNRESLFIDTVDKLQGRQRQVVIVSYGVTDPEKAVAELEFIYSRNRLNVSLTRGKKKTICILSDTLLDTRPDILNIDDDRIMKGINYMTGLLDFMQKDESDTCHGEMKDVSLDDVLIDIYRKRIR